jgi:hypothetical protein
MAKLFVRLGFDDAPETNSVLILIEPKDFYGDRNSVRSVLSRDFEFSLRMHEILDPSSTDC